MFVNEQVEVIVKEKKKKLNFQFLLDQEYDASVFGVQPKKNVGKEEEEEDDEKNEQSIEPKTMKRKFELVGTVMDHKVFFSNDIHFDPSD